MERKHKKGLKIKGYPSLKKSSKEGKSMSSAAVKRILKKLKELRDEK